MAEDIRMENQAGQAQAAEPAGDIVPEFYDEMGIIGPETKVTGNIVTKGHVTVLGSVKGDITAKGNVIIKGDVKGKIICDNALLEDCSISANIDAKSRVSIKEGVTVKGQINCGSISVMGTVIGNIEAKDKVGLSETAVIKGNVRSALIGTSLGAQIEGHISVCPE